jgi:hypothetical protein
MSFFSQLFGSKQQHQLAQMREEAEKRAEPIVFLANAIFQSALACAQAIRPQIDFPSERERERQWLIILHEFVYFFMHMTNRAAYRILGPDSRTRLYEDLGASVPAAVTEAVCGHWPAKLKSNLLGDFFHNLNNAELEYAECKQIFSETLAEDAVLTRLAFNISEHSGRGRDIATVMIVIETALGVYTAMHLDELVTNTRNAL